MKIGFKQNLLILLISPIVLLLGIIMIICQGISTICEFVINKLTEIIGL